MTPRATTTSRSWRPSTSTPPTPPASRSSAPRPSARPVWPPDNPSASNSSRSPGLEEHGRAEIEYDAPNHRMRAPTARGSGDVAAVVYQRRRDQERCSPGDHHEQRGGERQDGAARVAADRRRRLPDGVLQGVADQAGERLEDEDPDHDPDDRADLAPDECAGADSQHGAQDDRDQPAAARAHVIAG